MRRAMREKKSAKSGKLISNEAQVLGVTSFGLWVLVSQTEYFLPFTEFPWFLNSSVKDIFDLKIYFSNHLRWEKLDIDIELESLAHLEKYPLKYLGKK